MKTKEMLCSLPLALVISILFLILVLSTASAAAEQTSSIKTCAYVANFGSDNVSVIDTTTGTVIATVPLSPNAGPGGVAVTPDGTKVYVVNIGRSTVSVINTETNDVAEIVIGYSPHFIAITPDGKKAYVTNMGENTVSVIDTATNTATATISVGTDPMGIAVTPDGKKVYVTNPTSNTISVIDTTTDTVIATVTGGCPYRIVITPDGTKIYGTTGGTWISVIDTTTNKVTGIVNVGSYPSGIAVNPPGTKVYVTGRDEATGNGIVSVIDTATKTVTATVPVGNNPQEIAVTPDGTKVYVTNQGNLKVIGNIVSVIDTATNTVIDTITVGNNPYGIGICSVPVPKPVFPVADFSSNVTTGNAPLSVKFTDLSVDTTSWNWDFGDGTTSTEQSPVHTYPTAGTYYVNLTAINSNGKNSKTVTINVLTPPPTINSITVPLNPVPVGTNIAANASVTYLGNLNNLTAEWNWGDGSTSDSQGSSDFESSHAYNSAGIYTIKLTVTDADGRSDTQQSSDYIVVYDPQGGFVTGGGWINSPAGSYLPDNTLAGKATFGFVSKYQKGATVPTGNTEFQFKVAYLNFKSTSYDWLVVSGSQAKYKGTGTINGKGNYGFMLSAVDGAIKGDGIDKFRIKIWDKDTVNEDIIYDNEIDSGVEIEDAEPSTVISGGSIVIHKEK